MSEPLETSLSIAFIVVGLSHVLYSKHWAAFFETIFSHPGGPFLIAILTLPIGLLIVVTHNTWAWDFRTMVTFYGWASLFKGALYFLAPQVIIRLVTPKIRSARHFAIGGWFLLAWGAVMAVDVLRRA